MDIVGSTTLSITSLPGEDRGSSHDTLSEHQIHPDDAAPRSIALWGLWVPLAIAVVVMLMFQASRLAPTPQDSPAIGKTAPRLDLVRLTDQPLADRLENVTPGKVTLLHFWGTWCGPCKMEYPHLSELVERFRSRDDFEFVSVSCESGGQETFEGLRQKTDAFFASQGITGSAFADARGITRRSAAERLERNSMFYPTTILIGTDGKIVAVWEGYAPEAVEEMETLIEEQFSTGT